MLEEKIDELIAAVKELTVVIQSQSCGAPKAKAKKTTPKKEEVKKPEEETLEAKTEVTLDSLKEAIKNLCAKDGGRDLAIACLGEFDAEKATEVKPEDYAKCIEVLKKGLEDE